MLAWVFVGGNAKLLWALMQITEVKVPMYNVDPFSANTFHLKPGVITVCPRSRDPFYIVGNYIKWVITSWTQSILQKKNKVPVVLRN